MNKLLIPVLLALLLSGCPSTPVVDPNAGAPVETRTPTGQVTTVKADDVAATGLPRELLDAKSILSRRVIYFDLDKYDIKDEFRDLVAAHAKFLTAHRDFRILVQGHTDERGSSEYNLSLGQKRSDAVKKAMLLLGVKEDQIESVSLGKEKPAVEGHDESAWSQNRRAHILYKGPTGTGEF